MPRLPKLLSIGWWYMIFGLTNLSRPDRVKEVIEPAQQKRTKESSSGNCRMKEVSMRQGPLKTETCCIRFSPNSSYVFSRTHLSLIVVFLFLVQFKVSHLVFTFGRINIWTTFWTWKYYNNRIYAKSI